MNNHVPAVLLVAAWTLIGIAAILLALLLPAVFLAAPHRLRFRRRVEAKVLFATWTDLVLLLGSLGFSVVVAQRYLVVSAVLILYAFIPLVDVVSLYRRWRRFRLAQLHSRRPPPDRPW